MDVIATLIEVTAFDPSTNQTVVGRLTNRNDPRATTANGKSWLPILTSAPSVGTSVFNGAFTGAGQIDLGDFTITLADGLGDPFTGLVWDGADIKIYAGPMDGVSTMPLIYRAVGSGAQRRGRLELQVSLTTRASLLEVSLLTQSYAGNGQLEGDPGLKGTLKPWAVGYARFCKPVLINAAKQIWQVSAYGPIEGTTNVFEGGQEVTGFDGDKDLATMLGDDGPAQGKWWRNNQYGIFRLGSQPLYQITAHVRGDTNAVVGGAALTKIGDIIGRLVALTSTATIQASSLATLNAAVTKPFDDYFDGQQTVSEAMTTLLLSVGGYYTFDEEGDVIFGLVRFGQPVLNLDGMNRTEPTVMGMTQVPTSSPVWYLRLGAEQCHFVHDASNLPAIIVQQGADVAKAQATADAKNKTFPPSAQPPVGAVDGDQWPDTSVSPTTMRRYSSASGTWVATSNQITTANQVPYANGQTIEALKPAQSGSDVTAQNTASGIAGQGSLATINSLGYGSPFLTGFGALAPLGSVAFGSPYLLESGGGSQATLNAFKTILGIASGFSGQGSLATLSQLALGGSYLTGFGAFAGRDVVEYGSSFLSGFGALSPLNELFFGNPLLRETSGGASASLANFKTPLGIAAGFFNQGGLATRSDVVYGPGMITGLPSAIQPDGFYDNGRLLFASRVVYDDAGLVSGYRPEEAGANKTETRNSSGFYGQGALATLSALSNGGPYLSGFGNLSSLASIAFGSNYLLESSGGEPASLFNFKTILGTSSSITGQGSLATRSTADFATQVSGAGKPAANAGTSGQLKAIGSFIVIEGNTVYKTGGNHGSFEGGAVGTGQINTAFISSSVVSPIEGGGWTTFVALDTSYGNFDLYETTAYLRYIGAPNGVGSLFLDVKGVNSDFVQVTGVTTDTRITLVYDGVSFIGLLDGIQKVKLGPVTVGATLYPKVLPQYNDGDNTHDGYKGVRDVVYGPAYMQPVAGRTLQRSTGGILGDGDIITGLGQAASFFGQGSLATKNVVDPTNVNFKVGSGNRLRNGGMEKVAPDQAKPLGFERYDNGSANHSTGMASGRTGGLAFRINYTNFDGTAGMYLANNSEQYNNENCFVPNSTQIWSFWARAEGSSVGNPMRTAWNVSPIEQTWIYNPPLSNQWQKYAVQLKWGSTVDVNGFLSVSEVQFGTSGFVDFDDMAVEFGDVPSGHLPTVANIDPRSGYARLGIDSLLRTEGGLSPVTDANAITINGVAAGFSGQGTLATKNVVRLGSAAGDMGALVDENNNYYITNYLAVTSLGIASSVAGQGALATRSSVDDTYIGGALSNRVRPHPLNANYLTASTVAYPNGSGVDSLQPEDVNSNRTENRVSSAFAGQGSLATRNDIAYGSAMINGLPSAISPSAFFDNGRLLYASRVVYDDAGPVSSYRPEEAGSNKTETRTAASFYAQGAFATKSQAVLTDTSLFVATERFAASSYGSQWFQAENVAWGQGTGGTVQEYKPQDKGANVTETRVSSAIAGQGDLATKNKVAPTNVGFTVGSGNRVRNGGFETAGPIGSVNNVAAGFGAYVSGAGSTTYSIVAGRTGGKAQSIAFSQNDGVRGIYLLNGGDQLDNTYCWVPNSTQIWSFWARGSGAAIGAIIGTAWNLRPIEETWIYQPSLTDQWQKYAIRCKWGSNVDGNGFLTIQAGLSAGSWEIDDMAIEFGDVPSGYESQLSKIDPQSGYARLGIDSLLRSENGSTPITDANAITSNGVAASVAGQGALATRSSVDDTYIGGALSNRIRPHPLNANYLTASTVAYPDGAGVDALQPGEAGSNKTETRTAVAIINQAPTATSSDFSVITGSKKPSDNAGTAGVLRPIGNYTIIKGNTVAKYEPGTHGSHQGGAEGSGQVGTAFISSSLLSVVSGGGWSHVLALGPSGEINPDANAARLILNAQGNGSFYWDLHVPGINQISGTATGLTVNSRAALVYNGSTFAVVINGILRGEVPVASGLNLFPKVLNFYLDGSYAPDGIVGVVDVQYGSTYMLPVVGKTLARTSGATVTEPDIFTNQGIATSVAGQGPFVTRGGGVSIDDPSLFNLAHSPRLQPLDNGDNRFFNASVVQYGNNAIGYTDVQSLKPQESGSNRTETRTASAIASQGAFATQSYVNQFNVSQYFNFSAFQLNYSITRADGASIVTESLAITQLGVASGFSGQGGLATKNQAGPGDIAPSAVQVVTYNVLQSAVSCPVGN